LEEDIEDNLDLNNVAPSSATIEEPEFSPDQYVTLCQGYITGVPQDTLRKKIRAA
jgi:hypothetical protein